MPTRTAYSATKAGMVGMARTWALELAPLGITVNVVAPGPILTDNFWGIIPKGSEREAELAKRIPVGRLGTVEDVTNAFLFFCDPASGFVTGPRRFMSAGGASVGSVLAVRRVATPVFRQDATGWSAARRRAKSVASAPVITPGERRRTGAAGCLHKGFRFGVLRASVPRFPPRPGSA